jgi:hypothetical protein
MKIITLEESADFATLDTEKLFSKLKSHELSRKCRPNHDASLTSKVFVTSTHVGGHVANPSNTTDSSDFEFALSSLATTSDEQYEIIPDDEIALLVRKFAPCTSSTRRGGDHRGAASSAATPPTSSPTVPSGRSSTPPPTSTTTTTGMTPATRAWARRKYRFGDKKKKFQKMMSRACAALSDLEFSSDGSSNSEEDEKPKHKTGDFTSLCLMGKSLRHISDSDSDVSDDSSPRVFP